jgi:hypothetical protein
MFKKIQVIIKMTNIKMTNIKMINIKMIKTISSGRNKIKLSSMKIIMINNTRRKIFLLM